MSNANEPAFSVVKTDCPNSSHHITYILGGLTKREYFAAMAMQGIVSQWQHDWFPQDHAKLAVECADALLAELDRTQ